MNAPRFARNKRELARFTNMTHRTLYHLLRLPGCPSPKADGRWSVAEMKKFALKSVKKIEGPHERDRLQMELLNLKIQRASRELADYETELRAKIEAEIKRYVLQAIRVHGYHLKRLKTELCPRFEGRTTVEIYRMWREREKQIMKEFAADLSKPLSGFDLKQSNVLPFEQAKAI